MRSPRSWLVLALTIALAACSGSGSDGTTDAGSFSDTGVFDTAAPDTGPADTIAAPDGTEDVAPDGAPVDDVVPDVTVDAADAGEDVARVQWRQIAAPLGEDFVLHGLWGAEPNTVFAVGVAGTVLQLVGSEWQLLLSDPALDILNAVGGSGPGDAWAVGMGGQAIRWDGERWRLPDTCSDDADCGADDPCRAGTCREDGFCELVPTAAEGCCGTTLVRFDFDAGEPHGFEVVDLYAEDPDHGGMVWQAVEIADPTTGDPRYTSPPHALYFGDPTRSCPDDPGSVCPDYDNGRKVGATATSPAFTLPVDADRATLRFQLFLEVEASNHYDVLQVFVLEDGTPAEVWRKTAIAGGTTLGRFFEVSVDLSRFIGRTIQLQLAFDTLEQTDNDYEGVYVDDVTVTTTCGSLSEGLGLTDTLWGVWSSAPNDLFAVGGAGAILRYDGARWQRMMGGPIEMLASIDGAGPEEMVIVGQGGLSLRGPKGGWTRHETGVTADLESVWVHGPSLALAVGLEGTALRWDGGGWQTMETPSVAGLHGVDGSAPNDALAVGEAGTVIVFDGAAWRMSAATGTTGSALFGVWRGGPGNSWIVGDASTILRETARDVWQSIDPGTSEGLRAVIGFANGTALAAGLGGRWVWIGADGTTATGFVPGGATVFALDGTGPNDVWAVGLDGSLSHWNGGAWSAQLPIVEVPIRGVYAVAADDVWAVAEGGLIFRFDGEEWTVVRSTTTATLRDVWSAGPSRAVAVGARATILHFDGINWLQHFIEPVEIPDSDPWIIDVPLHAVWGTAADDIWAAGGSGVLVHWDGETWTYTQSMDERRRTLWSLWGRAADDIWAVGAEGAILHYDGTRWDVQETNSIATLFGVWGIGHRTWAVGSLGTILQHTPPRDIDPPD